MGDWIAIIIAILASLPGILTTIQQRRKDNAETTDTLTKIAMSLVQPLREQNESLVIQNQAVKDEKVKVEEGARKLFYQVIELGGRPAYTPEGITAPQLPAQVKSQSRKGRPRKSEDVKS